MPQTRKLSMCHQIARAAGSQPCQASCRASNITVSGRWQLTYSDSSHRTHHCTVWMNVYVQSAQIHKNGVNPNHQVHSHLHTFLTKHGLFIMSWTNAFRIDPSHLWDYAYKCSSCREHEQLIRDRVSMKSISGPANVPSSSITWLLYFRIYVLLGLW